MVGEREFVVQVSHRGGWKEYIVRASDEKEAAQKTQNYAGGRVDSVRRAFNENPDYYSRVYD